MSLITSRLTRRAIVTATCAAGVIAGVVLPALPATASTSAGAHPRPVVTGSGYLALGDSVTFGYREADTSPPPDYSDAATFVGYPEDIGAALGLRVTNAACPGETSGSLNDAAAQSNGCEATATGGPGYRSAYPLHATYTGSQLGFALRFLRHHRDTRLVSLMIGANDTFICEAETADNCASEFPAVLAKIEANVTTTLAAIRHRAHYRGQIVILNYYTTDYTSATGDEAAEALNAAQDSAARPFGVEIADGYGAFKFASAHSGDNPCTAGLLTQLTGAAEGTCGVHPSVAGQSVLAQAVEEAVRK